MHGSRAAPFLKVPPPEKLRVSAVSAMHRPAIDSARAPTSLAASDAFQLKKKKKKEYVARFCFHNELGRSRRRPFPVGPAGKKTSPDSQKPSPTHWECGGDREQSTFLTSAVTALLRASFQTHHRSLFSCQRLYSTFEERKGGRGGGRKNNTSRRTGTHTVMLTASGE